MTLLLIDQSLTNSLYDLTRDNADAARIIYAIASYLIIALPIALIWLFWSQPTRQTAVKIFVFTIFTWQGLNKTIGNYFYDHYAFRDRPFAFNGLKELLFEQPQKAFPSDHAAVFMFVTLALFYYRQKTWAWIFLGLSIATSFARVAIGFHWIGDILGGWLVGLIGFGLLVWLDKPLQKLFDKISLNKTKNDQLPLH